MTQETVAEAVGVNRRTVNLWESGKTEPTRRRLELLATLYGQGFEWFTTGAGDPVTKRLDEMRERMTRLPQGYLDALDSIMSEMEKAASIRSR